MALIVGSGGGLPTRPAGVWVAGLVALAVVCLLGVEGLSRRPLFCRDLEALALSCKRRYIFRIALIDLMALAALGATFVVGRGWVYWVSAPFTLYGLGRIMPTKGRIGADQQRLRQAGCDQSLVSALNHIPDPW